jgi:hypothetical protein
MNKLFFLFLTLALAAPIVSEAQCKNFVKKKCSPHLDNYVPSDKFNSLKMVQGEEAEMFLVFVANHDYRVIVCSQQILGDVSFELLTDRGVVIYSSVEHDGENAFNFSTTSTEKLQVIIRVPGNESATGMMHEGCVTVMVGSISAS